MEPGGKKPAIFLPKGKSGPGQAQQMGIGYSYGGEKVKFLTYLTYYILVLTGYFSLFFGACFWMTSLLA